MEEKKNARISIRIKSSTFEKLYKIAARNNRSMSWVVEEILRKYLRLK
jgi:predicted transcriptional regulator